MSEIVMDSRTVIDNLERTPYVSSESDDRSWGQPPASHFFLVVRGLKVVGRSVTGYASSFSASQILDFDLRQEFASFEAASDEDLLRFEEELE